MIIKNKGYSLIEMLIAVAIFSILGVISAQTILLSVRSAKKSENTIKARQEIDQITNLLQTQLRNADEIETCNPDYINYTDSSGNTGRTFNVQADGDIIWNSGQLNSDNTTLNISFNCIGNSTSGGPDNPDTIMLTFTVQSAGQNTAEGSAVTVNTEIKPRYYVE